MNLLESTYFGDRQLLLEAIAKCCRDFDDQNCNSAQIYAFWFGQPLPQWIERIEFDREKISTGSEEIALQSVKTVVNSEANSVLNNELICDRFIVCGLGSLGQHSVFNLKKFAYQEYEVKICAIDKAQPEVMEFDNFTELLDQPMILGDCRRSEVLIKAGTIKIYPL